MQMLDLANFQLQRYLETTDDNKAQQLLEKLILQYAIPTIQAELRRKTTDREEQEAIQETALDRLLIPLFKLRKGEGTPIRHFKAFVRTLASQAFGDFLDDKYPERRRLKHRLYDHLNRQPAFSTWQTKERGRLCGLAHWEAENRAVLESLPLKKFREDPRTVLETRFPQDDVLKVHEERLLNALFHYLNHPIEFEELVSLMARARGIQTVVMLRTNREGDEGAVDLYEQIPDPQNIAEMMEQRDFLRRQWAEICRLKHLQRAALLLGMKDDQDGNALNLFVTMQIAQLSDIANTLEMSWDRFVEIWKELPLSDNRIAEILNITAGNVRVKRTEARKQLKARNPE